jgi:hypothetical protein
MAEQLMAMSGDFDGDFSHYQQVGKCDVESAMLTIVECGTQDCTIILC